MECHLFTVDLDLRGTDHSATEEVMLQFMPETFYAGLRREWELIHRALEAGQYVIEGGFPCIGSPEGQQCDEHHPARRICGWIQREGCDWPGWETLWPPPKDWKMLTMYELGNGDVISHPLPHGRTLWNYAAKLYRLPHDVLGPSAPLPGDPG